MKHQKAGRNRRIRLSCSYSLLLPGLPHISRCEYASLHVGAASWKICSFGEIVHHGMQARRRRCVLKSCITEGVKIPLLWQTLTFAVRFICILATLHQQIPRETLCLEEPERTRRLVAYQAILHQTTGAHQNTAFAMGDWYRAMLVDHMMSC